VAAIWMLVLAGAIAAVLMLRGLGAATEATDQADDLRNRLLMESAIETVMADRQFNGPRGRWWLLPATGDVDVDGVKVEVRLSSESGRLDINEADPALIDRALIGLGLAGVDRAALIAHLRGLRSQGGRIGSFAELRRLVDGAGGRACALEALTFSSALAEPGGGELNDALAKALGRTVVNGANPATAGSTLRFEIMSAGGAPAVRLVRSGISSGAIEVLDHSSGKLCQ